MKRNRTQFICLLRKQATCESIFFLIRGNVHFIKETWWWMALKGLFSVQTNAKLKHFGKMVAS